jgi:hypothetical protein
MDALRLGGHGPHADIMAGSDVAQIRVELRLTHNLAESWESTAISSRRC